MQWLNQKLSDWEALIRSAKYFKGKERHQQLFNYQESTARDSNKFITVWADTDYAGCPSIRTLTRGGVCMFISHVPNAWSGTQGRIALSGGEAEHYGLVKAAAHGVRIRNVMLDLGSVAKSIPLIKFGCRRELTAATSKLKRFPERKMLMIFRESQIGR